MKRKFDKAIVKPVTFQLRRQHPVTLKPYFIELGSFDDIQNQSKMLQGDDAQQVHWAYLPRDEYVIYAPIIGSIKNTLGKKPVISHELQALVNKIVSGSFDKKEIQKAFEAYPTLKEEILSGLYFSLILYANDKGMGDILTKFKPIFSELVAMGARFFHIQVTEKDVYEDLLKYAFNQAACTQALSQAHLRETGFAYEHFVELADKLLPLGADINARMYTNSQYGTFLHYYLAFEMPFPRELIAYFEAKRGKEKNTQFNYTIRDEMNGNTPLLIALLTGRLDAVLALLKLERNGLPVGINMADSKGRSPLLIAAALGMQEAVAQLLELGARPNHLDDNGKGLSYYAHLSKTETFGLLATLVHPDRSAFGNHSYLYCNDNNASPLCFYEAGEEEKFGDDQFPHLVVLSNSSPHKERLERVVACLQEAVKKGDRNAYYLLQFVLQQIERIKHSPSLIDHCLNNRKAVQNFLATRQDGIYQPQAVDPETTPPVEMHFAPSKSVHETKEAMPNLAGVFDEVEAETFDKPYEDLDLEDFLKSIQELDRNSQTPSQLKHYMQTVEETFSQAQSNLAASGSQQLGHFEPATEFANLMSHLPARGTNELVAYINGLAPNATCLDLAHKALDTQGREALVTIFETCPKTVESVNISYNGFLNQLPTLNAVLRKFPTCFPALKKLDLSKNQLALYASGQGFQAQDVNSDIKRMLRALGNLPQLSTLNLSENRLARSYKFFKHLSCLGANLTTLILRDNGFSIEDLKRIISSQPKGVITLDVSENGFDKIPEDILLSLVQDRPAGSNLKYIYFSPTNFIDLSVNMIRTNTSASSAASVAASVGSHVESKQENRTDGVATMAARQVKMDPNLNFFPDETRVQGKGNNRPANQSQDNCSIS